MAPVRIQPWWCETFKFSTDPELEAKIRDVVGLYLHPPENAVVLSVDEKSRVLTLECFSGFRPDGSLTSVSSRAAYLGGASNDGGRDDVEES